MHGFSAYVLRPLQSLMDAQKSAGGLLLVSERTDVGDPRQPRWADPVRGGQYGGSHGEPAVAGRW